MGEKFDRQGQKATRLKLAHDRRVALFPACLFQNSQIPVLRGNLLIISVQTFHSKQKKIGSETSTERLKVAQLSSGRAQT